ncbi:casein kinase II, alpha chain [Tricladium varicosporioides]|nr:casein kinase II, alpha chain [Hymenoscyphus varicosporioides]
MAGLYSDVIQSMSKGCWDFSQGTINWGNVEIYEIISKIGRGKHSEVFTGINTFNNRIYAIKVLKPVKKKILNREVKILQSLAGGTNIISLFDVVKDSHSETLSLIFEYVDNTDFRSLYPKFNEDDIRFYMLELLKALDFCHTQGVMHRDIRPHNVMIDHKARSLRLIDFGQAEFYYPGTKYSVRVGSPCHKAPELLLYCQEYDTSVDMWSLGVMFASMIFRKEPFFHGNSNSDLLVRISKVLGTDSLWEYIDKNKIDLDSQYDDILGTSEKKPWKSFVVGENKRFANNEALDFLDKVLRYDHQDRLTAKEAICHTYFNTVNKKGTLKQLLVGASSTSNT